MIPTTGFHSHYQSSKLGTRFTAYHPGTRRNLNAFLVFLRKLRGPLGTFLPFHEHVLHMGGCPDRSAETSLSLSRSTGWDARTWWHDNNVKKQVSPGVFCLSNSEHISSYSAEGPGAPRRHALRDRGLSLILFQLYCHHL